MGEAAEDALDRMMDMDELQTGRMYDIDGGDDDDLYQDYDGTIFPTVFSRRPRQQHGPGACPKCGWATHKATGKFGEFYGCGRFPACKGSRGQ